MKQLNNKELNAISGGAISASMFNAIFRGADLFLELGRSLGSALRRYLTGKFC